MAKEKDLKELFIDTLKDIYFAEKKILSALPKMAKAAHSPKLKAAFEAAYGTVYGLTIPGQQAEITTWSVTVSSSVKPPAPARKAPRKSASKAKHVRKVFDSKAGKLLPTPVYWRFDLAAGATFKGPAIIAEHETSTLVASGFTARIDTAGYIHLERNA